MVKRWRIYQKETRDQRVKLYYEDFRKTAQEIAIKGKFPTRRLVNQGVSGIPGLKTQIKITRKYEQEICNRICREVETPIGHINFNSHFGE